MEEHGKSLKGAHYINYPKKKQQQKQNTSLST